MSGDFDSIGIGFFAVCGGTYLVSNRLNRQWRQKGEPRKQEERYMKRRILVSCMMTVVCFSVVQSVASAQETPGIDGIWIGNVVAADCTSHMPLPGAVPFRALYMFGHDGSLTTEAAFFVPVAPRSSGLGTWKHNQGQTYASKFWFFRYKAEWLLPRFPRDRANDTAQRRPIHDV
jgi:hypothetical protein